MSEERLEGVNVAVDGVVDNGRRVRYMTIGPQLQGWAGGSLISCLELDDFGPKDVGGEPELGLDLGDAGLLAGLMVGFGSNDRDAGVVDKELAEKAAQDGGCLGAACIMTSTRASSTTPSLAALVADIGRLDLFLRVGPLGLRCVFV